MKKLLLGTHNKTKIAHCKKFFKDFSGTILSLDDVKINDEPEETGSTLEQNALLKARYYFKKSGLPSLADDAGFEIPALGNFPGVNSRRFNPQKTRMSDKEVICGIIHAMKGLKGDQRKARMKVAIALALPASNVRIACGIIEGVVPEQPFKKIMNNFPYRSLLFVTALNKWFYDVTEEEEETLGYRKAAVEQLKKYL